MNKYWKYFKYILEHKKNVFIECWKEGLYLHAFTHDFSKFLPCEFVPYARKFHGEKRISKLLQGYIDRDFQKAWEHHYKHNKHHWNYWIGEEMPPQHIKQMVCDWKGMSRKFGDTSQEFYLKHYHKIILNRESRFKLELELDLIRHYNAPICECNEEYWQTIEELIKNSEEYYIKHSKIAHGTVENNINNLLKHACDKYNVNIYQLVNESIHC